ncbi:beta-lactamase [Cellulophaga sp. RHA_52]|uniref:serine hydrolase domain-containing protein n=1 Tax=Cellulophaga sp. RHA_52 TaxID=1250036 RepID=UPI00119C1B89|nr:serine hydrolase domain-containing protein [Cellulophaga sp. RHA_52]TVZ08135.1 beta-lactamase [Cellulophaga sp. RHA_52]
MTKIMTKIVLLNLFITLFGCQNNENIDTYLNRLHGKGELNGNVLIIKDGITLYEKSFGFTDGSKNTMLTKDYRFNIGSIYKEFPAVSIMQLQEKNQINLEDKISKYIPELPNWSEKISVQNLMQYSSGLPTIGWDIYFSQGINVNDNHIMEELKSLKNLEFEPGSDYLYSNSNPILLIKIIENITKTTFNNYLKENIFIPYGMESTIIKEQYPYEDKTLMAIPFNTDFKEDDYKLSVKSLLFSSTANNMANWFEQLDDFKIINEKSVKKLSDQAKKGDDIQSPLGNTEWKNDKIIEHSHHGSTASYECIARRFKKDGITLVILTNQNQGNVYEISEQIYDIIKSDI